MSAKLLAILVFLDAFLFFGLLPGIGAFQVRARWRRFRRRILQASLYPFVGYPDQGREGFPVGRFRAFGSLEAIHGENRVWIQTGGFSVEVDLAGVSLILLPSGSPAGPSASAFFERSGESLPDEEPEIVDWEQISSLPSGTRLFVAGPFFAEAGTGIFRSLPREPLVVVIYEGDESRILLRAIWAGRQRNEYWNRFTPASLITGSFSLLLASFIMLPNPAWRLPSLLALALSCFPPAIFLPPGVLLYLAYQALWKRARALRAERDLLRLPLRYFPNGSGPDGGGDRLAKLPDGESYLMTRRSQPIIQGSLIIRESSLNRPALGYYTLFGAYRREERFEVLDSPRDPMAEVLLILGDPERLSAICSRRARYLAAFSAICFLAGITLNLVLLLLLWSSLIR